MRILHTGQTKPVSHVAILPDGQTIAAARIGGFDLIDLPTGRVTPCNIPRAKEFWSFQIDPQGRRLLYSAVAGGFGIFDLVARKFRIFPGNDDHVISIGMSGDGSRVTLSRGVVWNHTLECWTLNDQEPTLAWRVPCSGMSHATTFHPSRDEVVTIETQGERPEGDLYSFVLRQPREAMIVRRTTDGTLLRSLGSISETLRLSSGFSAATNEYLLWDGRGLQLIDIDHPKKKPRLRKHPGAALFRGVAAHPSGRFFCTAANDGVARYWCLESLSQIQAFGWKAGKLQSVTFSADGMLAAAGTDKGAVVVWDVDL